MEFINADALNERVIEPSHQEPVFTYFWASWCGPCQMVSPIMDRLTNELEVTSYKFNSDHNPKLVSDLQIRGIPTVIVWRNGKPLDRFVGAMAANSIQQWMEKWL